MAAPGLVDCSNVYTKPDAWGGAGCFARVPFNKGDLIERGIVRVLPMDGNDSPYVFTWSEAEPRKWASGSGMSVFYNMCADPNAHMARDFENNTFEIYAIRDIAKDEEIFHVYISSLWRECFTDMKPIAEEYMAKHQGKEKDVVHRHVGPARDEPEPIGNYPGIIDMSKVFVERDAWGGAGAFARTAIKRGEVVEKGIVRVLPVDGNESPFVFTWSETEPRKWASGSGASVFYNMSDDPNTHMTRDFTANTFEIVAARDIREGEEVTHVYISATWRKCFEDLKPMAEKYLASQSTPP